MPCKHGGQHHYAWGFLLLLRTAQNVTLGDVYFWRFPLITFGLLFSLDAWSFGWWGLAVCLHLAARYTWLEQLDCEQCSYLINPGSESGQWIMSRWGIASFWMGIRHACVWKQSGPVVQGPRVGSLTCWFLQTEVGGKLPRFLWVNLYWQYGEAIWGTVGSNVWLSLKRYGDTRS